MQASSATEGIGQSAEKLRTFVLASASPRRRELLGRMGIVFLPAAADIDEQPLPGEQPLAYSSRLAAAKAEACASQYPDQAILAADTVVTIDGDILGKPEDAAQAKTMLGRLQNRTHLVMTSFCIRSPHHGDVHRSVITEVDVSPLSSREIDAYVASGEWRDKAGGYAIQGLFAYAVAAIRGSYTNVVGLPLAEVVTDLVQLGVLDRERFPADGFGQ